MNDDTYPPEFEPPESTEPPDLRGMVHRDDPHTSRRAATFIERNRTKLHKLVLAALATHGPMTDEELEDLPDFTRYGPSTIRKRRSELYQDNKLVVVGQKKNARNFLMLIWALAPPPRRVYRSLLPPPPTVHKPPPPVPPTVHKR